MQREKDKFKIGDEVRYSNYGIMVRLAYDKDMPIGGRVTKVTEDLAVEFVDSKGTKCTVGLVYMEKGPCDADYIKRVKAKGHSVEAQSERENKGVPLDIEHRRGEEPLHKYFADRLPKYFAGELPEGKIAEAKVMLGRVNDWLSEDYKGGDARILCEYIVKSYKYDVEKEVPLTSAERVAFVLACECALRECARGNRSVEGIKQSYSEQLPPFVSMTDRPFIEPAIRGVVEGFKNKDIGKVQ